MKDGDPYLLACGRCQVPMKVHPVKQCPYLYTPIKQGKKLVGYKMRRKK
jgi:hypothetical protein